MDKHSRRDFLRKLSAATGAVVIAPVAIACGGNAEVTTAQVTTPSAPPPIELPRVRPELWDAIDFNRRRGLGGAIPLSFQDDINGPDGRAAIGKHLPYIPYLQEEVVPRGMIGLMFGDEGAGFPRHPAAPIGMDNEGHRFDWIRIRKATESEAEEKETRFSDWPIPDSGGYAVYDGGELTDESGKNTVYVAELPADVEPGDLVRVVAHCNLHGEYVQFVTVPGGG